MNITPESIQRQVTADEDTINRRLERGNDFSSAFPESTMLDYQRETIQRRIVDVLHNDGIDTESLPELPLDPSPEHIDADYGIVLFPLARPLRQSPVVIAENLSSKLNEGSSDNEVGPAFSAKKAYLNFSLERPSTYDAVVREVVAESENFGNSRTNRHDTVLIDYSSPNIAKRLGMQHLPTTVVGESLARINEATGAQVIRVNHLGDFGTSFGKVLVGIERYNDPERMEADPIGFMHELYVRINQEAKDDDTLDDAAREAFARLEQGDPATVALWARLRAMNIQENNKLYDRMGVAFDTTVGESYYAESAQKIVDELLASGIAIEDKDGSVVVTQSNTGGIPLMLRKRDGSTLYGTRDLAALRYRMQEYNPDIMRYVVGSEQGAQLDSVFAVASLAGIIPDRERTEHVRLGLLSDQNGKKLSSRGGMTSTLESILDNATEVADASLSGRESLQDMSDTERKRLAAVLGNGGVFYSILRRDPSSNTHLGADAGAARATGSAGYLQYAHARAATLVEKGKVTNDELLAGQLSLESDAEWEVAKSLLEFQDSVAKAAETNGPHHIAQALEGVAGTFNTLYQSDVSVLRAEKPELRRSRLALGKAVQITLKNGLNLLAIDAPDKV